MQKYPPHGVPPWAKEEFLGFYVEILSPSDVDIWLSRMAKLKRQVGDLRFHAAMQVIYHNATWQQAYRDHNIPVEPLNWEAIKRALISTAAFFEETIKHGTVEARWGDRRFIADFHSLE